MDVFHALSDPTRRAIIDELQARDGQSLFELCARLVTNHGLTSTRQAVSQHLEVLESVGLVTSRREGRYKLLFLDTSPLRPVVDRWLGPDPEARDPAKSTRAGEGRERAGMRVTWVTLFVDDQERARLFYTETLGFIVRHDIPLGADRWLTLASPADRDGVELVLEPSTHPAVTRFREALAADGIPAHSFAVDDVDSEYEYLRSLGVHFTQQPAAMGATTTAVFDDTCGNLIQIHHLAEQKPAASHHREREHDHE